MNDYGLKSKDATLKTLGLGNVANAFWNLPPAQLVEESLILGMGELASSGALAIDTGEFTGRSPKDRFIVEDEITRDTVWWGNINIKFDSEKFDLLYGKLCAYLSNRDVYVRDAYACADENYRLNLRVVTEYPWSNQFASNMFLRPTKDEIDNFDPEWHVICAPGFEANPEIDGKAA
jgi:phosphoenolpyruvate carboxykinase (ATP)